MSIVEVITVTCHPLPVYDESYYYYADTGCNTETSWGVGIWCSVVVSCLVKPLHLSVCLQFDITFFLLFKTLITNNNKFLCLYKANQA